YLLLRRTEVSLCAFNPGFPEQLCLRTDCRTLIGWWRGDLTLRQAIDAGFVLDRRRELGRAFPRGFPRYVFAEGANARQGRAKPAAPTSRGWPPRRRPAFRCARRRRRPPKAETDVRTASNTGPLFTVSDQRVAQAGFERAEPGLVVAPLRESLAEDRLAYLLRAGGGDTPLRLVELDAGRFKF